MKYRIGDVERLLGVSSDTIRFFERKGVVKPIKIDSNNYRLFSAMDIHKLVAYRYYRNMDFSADESVNMLNHYSHKKATEELVKQIDVIEGKLKHYSELFERMQDLKKSYFSVDTLVNSYEIENSPQLVFYYNQVNHQFDKDEEGRREITQKWLEQVPFVWMALNIPLNEMPEGNNIYWGYAIDTKHKERIKSLDLTYARTLPSRPCLHTIVKCSSDEVLKPSRLRGAIDYIADQGLRMAGDAIGWIINEEKHNTQFTRYFEIWIPVEGAVIEAHQK